MNGETQDGKRGFVMMNEFTKDELQMLIHGIHLSIDEHNQHRYAPLANKIYSLIDNYCEHDMESESGEFRHCKKCWAKE